MLHPELRSLLESLRQRIRRYVVWDSLLAIAVVFLSAFWIGWMVDYLPVLVGGSEMPRSARGALLAIVLTIVVVLVARMLVARLRRPLPDDSLALLVERQHPQLSGRLITAVQLTQPNRTGDSHSADLLKMVHRQAAETVHEVDPAKVFRSQPLIRKASIAIPLLLLCLGYALFNPSGFAQAAARLSLFSDARWPRRAKLEMVGIELPVVTASSQVDGSVQRLVFENNEVRLPKGSSATLRIQAVADDAEVPSVCTVYYKTDDGTRGQSNMRRVGRERDGYQSFVLDGPPLSNLDDSFTFSVQGLDDRLVDFRIAAIEPPAITAMEVGVRYPDYLRSKNASVEKEATDSSQFDLQTPYEAGLRISEGSVVTLTAKTSSPIGEVDAVVEYDGIESAKQQIDLTDDGMGFSVQLQDFRRPTAVRLVPSDQSGISAQSPFRYFLGAIVDEAPMVRISLDGIQNAVTPVAKIPIQCTASDDYGLRSLVAFAAKSDSSTTEDLDPSVPAEGDPNLPSNDTFSLPMAVDRDGQAETLVDLRELVNGGTLSALEPGGAINVYAEAKDGYNLDGEHLTTSELFRLQIVTAEELLMLLERRELGLRTRLEQTVSETEGLKDQLARFVADRFSVSGDETEEQGGRKRALQILRLRVQQSGLQASKTTQELTGIAESLDDILREMANNRVDSADRQERLGAGVRDPLRRIVSQSMKTLSDRIALIEQNVENAPEATRVSSLAVQDAEQVLLQLNEVLEKMLDLESYNEILDIVRGLIDDQEKLKADTKKERLKRVRNLFD